MFLLQPIHVYFSQSSTPKTITPIPLLNIPVLSDQTFNPSPLQHLKPHQFPSIDRLIFTDQSIISTTFHSLESVAEVQLLPLSSQSLTQLIERSMAEVIVLMDNSMQLDSLDMTLGIRHLWDNHLDAVKPKSLSPEIVEKRMDQGSDNPYPELHRFLNIMISDRTMTSSMPYHETSSRKGLESSSGHHCYIVRRSVLLSLLKRWEWLQTGSRYNNEKVQVERLYTVIGMS